MIKSGSIQDREVVSDKFIWPVLEEKHNLVRLDIGWVRRVRVLEKQFLHKLMRKSKTFVQNIFCKKSKKNRMKN